LKDNEYKSRLKKLKSELNQSKDNFENSNENLNSIKEKSSELIDINNKNIEYVNKTLFLVDSFPNESGSIEKIEFDQAFDSASLFGEALARQSFSLFDRSKHFDESFRIIVAGTNVSSSSTDAASAAIFTLASEFDPIHQSTKEAMEKYKLPSTLEKKEELSNWLEEIDNTLSSKYDEAFFNLENSKFMSACHALRDCLSHFLEKLAPDYEVQKCSWYITVPNTSRPTQKQRIKYSIIGNTDENILSDDDLEVLENLMTEGRDIYAKLSKEAHSRKGNWEEKRTKTYFEITNSVFTTIKKLRNEL
jgi:hypothetical protein